MSVASQYNCQWDFFLKKADESRGNSVSSRRASLYFATMNAGYVVLDAATVRDYQQKIAELRAELEAARASGK